MDARSAVIHDESAECCIGRAGCRLANMREHCGLITYFYCREMWIGQPRMCIVVGRLDRLFDGARAQKGGSGTGRVVTDVSKYELMCQTAGEEGTLLRAISLLPRYTSTPLFLPSAPLRLYRP